MTLAHGQQAGVGGVPDVSTLAAIAMTLAQGDTRHHTGAGRRLNAGCDCDDVGTQGESHPCRPVRVSTLAAIAMTLALVSDGELVQQPRSQRWLRLR